MASIEFPLGGPVREKNPFLPYLPLHEAERVATRVAAQSVGVDVGEVILS